MRIARDILLVAAGLAVGFAGERMRPVTAVHAEDKYSTLGGCIAHVPSSWGTFRGASDYGLAFEDNYGTVRFLARPSCGSGQSMVQPDAAVDLKIDRR
jgi:hypothetical protein